MLDNARKSYFALCFILSGVKSVKRGGIISMHPHLLIIFLVACLAIMCHKRLLIKMRPQ